MLILAFLFLSFAEPLPSPFVQKATCPMGFKDMTIYGVAEKGLRLAGLSISNVLLNAVSTHEHPFAASACPSMETLAFPRVVQKLIEEGKDPHKIIFENRSVDGEEVLFRTPEIEKMVADEARALEEEMRRNPEVPFQSIYDSKLRSGDRSGNSTKEFFRKLKDSIKTTIAFQRERTRGFRKCVEQKHYDDCVLPHSGMAIRISSEGAEPKFSDVVREARFHLALGQGQRLTDNLLNGGSKATLNWQLNTYGMWKAENFQAMSRGTTEYDRAMKTLRRYREEAASKTEKMPRANGRQQRQIANKQGEYIKEKRDAHYGAFLHIFAANPLLQYVQSPNPTNKEIAEGLDKVLKALDKEEAWLEEKTRSIDSGELDTELLHLLNYTGEVASVVNDNPEFCAISKSLFELKQAKQIGMEVGTGLLVMGASMLFPPTYAIVAGVGIGMGFGGYYHFQASEKAARELESRIISAPSNQTLLEVYNLTQTRDVNLALTPVGMGLMSGAVRNTRLGASLRSMKESARKGCYTFLMVLPGGKERAVESCPRR